METQPLQTWLEKGLLNSLIHHPQLVRLHPETTDEALFQSPAHRLILQSIIELSRWHDDNARIGFNELACHLAERGVLEEVGGREYLDMIDDPETGGGPGGEKVWKMYCDAMLTHYQLSLLTAAIQSPAPNQSERLAEIRSTLEMIERPFSARELVDTTQALERILLDPDQQENPPNLVSFGIAKLDAMLNLTEPGKVITIGAATSGGKTALACQAVRESGVTSLIFSLEMGWREIWDRLLVGDSAINYNNYLQKRLLADERQRLGKSLERFRTGQTIWIDSEPPIKMEDIEAAAERLSDQGLRLLVVDYLQLLTPSAARKDASREQEVADISRRLKLLARRLDLIVVSLSQLNDQGKVRESRAIAQDSDVVILIELGEGESCLNLWKQRTGRTGKIPVEFDGDRMRFIPK